MFSETTLFGVLLVLAVLFTLVFLLTKKPHFRLRETLVGTNRKERKSDKDKKGIQPPKTQPRHFEYPRNAPIPQDRLSSAKTTESQAESSIPQTLTHKEERPERPASIVQPAGTPESTEKPPGPVEAPKVTEEKPVPTRSARPQLRPPNCTHFFGYLRKIPKNVSMPDECFGCPKMVECLYYDITPE